MRVPDACRFTGISRSTLYLLIARGEIEVVKLGAATLVLTDSLRKLIERQRGCQPSPFAVPMAAGPPGRKKGTKFGNQPGRKKGHNPPKQHRWMSPK